MRHTATPDTEAGMSIASARSFFIRMKTDEEFARRVLACRTAGERIALVQDEGFAFSLADAQAAAADPATPAAAGSNR